MGDNGLRKRISQAKKIEHIVLAATPEPKQDPGDYGQGAVHHSLGADAPRP